MGFGFFAGFGAGAAASGCWANAGDSTAIAAVNVMQTANANVLANPNVLAKPAGVAAMAATVRLAGLGAADAVQ